MSNSEKPTVSVVVNTLNRAPYLGDALAALQGLDYPSVEVIVVNGPSTDETAAVLAPWADRIKLGDCPEANLSMSRNVGVNLASGDIIAFMDDDAAPHPQWVSRLVDVFRDPLVGAAGGFTIDNTGVRWQVRKTICDRFGNAYNVSPMFDERPLCQPGAPYYPSLLGTNSAFRASALRQIGGFDHTFAYLLDETDVCLRLIDAGWRVAYEPTAMIYHQFAPSHIRSRERVARTLYPSAVSKAYFVMRHGARQSIGEAAAQLELYRQSLLDSNQWHDQHGRIDEVHRFSLDQDLLKGVEVGVEAARNRTLAGGDLRKASIPPFKPFERTQGLTIALVSQGFPPETEAGIARWTCLAAKGLAERGHQVHVITQASGEESVQFHDGLWIHRLNPTPEGALEIREAFDVPPNIADWAARVWQEVQHLKSFALDVVSFPIWDLEGLAVLDDPELTVVVSLHTTYAMAKPFKVEWNLRPLFEFHIVDKVIAAERAVLARAPTLLANSKAVIDTIGELYQLEVADRCVLVPHGTPDPLATRAARAAERERRVEDGAPLRILFVGRFEQRKGFTIAAQVARLLEAGPVGFECWFAGDHLDEDALRDLAEAGVNGFGEGRSIRLLGKLGREALDDAYTDCDILLAPSRFESFGLIGIEAMAARRPVFTLAGSGLAEVVEDGQTGRVWEETDDVAQRIVAEIRRLDGDRRALLDMGGRARAAFELRYSVETMVEGLDRAYRQAIAGHSLEQVA